MLPLMNQIRGLIFNIEIFFDAKVTHVVFHAAGISFPDWRNYMVESQCGHSATEMNCLVN